MKKKQLIHSQSKQWLDICQHNIPVRTQAINVKVKRDRNGKKGDDLKSKDKDNNVTGASVAHVGNVTPPEDFATPRGRGLV